MAGSGGDGNQMDAVPTYPLQNLREMDDSKPEVEKFGHDGEKTTRMNGSDSLNRTSDREFGNLSKDSKSRAYKGVYIDSQVR